MRRRRRRTLNRMDTRKEASESPRILLKKSVNMSDYRKNMAIYRNTPTGDGGSPSELMFNRKWKSHLPELPKYSE